MSVRLAVIILAAGEASRYGSNKLLSQHPDGGTLLNHVLSQYQPLSALPVTLVTGCYDREISDALASTEALRVVKNADWQTGMGSSIATGVRAVMALAETSPASLYPTHFMIGLADTPGITTAGLQELVDKAMIFPTTRIASEADGFRMSPAIFPLADEDALCGLQGKKGASKLLNAAAPECIAVPHPEACVDIDTPEDWNTFTR